jgi:hypothetical protein
MAAIGFSIARVCLLGAALVTTAGAQEPDRAPPLADAFAIDEEAMARAKGTLAAALAEPARKAKEDEARADASRRLMFDQQPLGTPTTIAPIETAQGGLATPGPGGPEAKQSEAAHIRHEAPPAAHIGRVETADRKGDAETAPRASAARQASAQPAPAPRDKTSAAAARPKPKPTREAAKAAPRPQGSDLSDVETTGSVDPAGRAPSRRISSSRQKLEARRARRRLAATRHANGFETFGRRVGFAVRCLFRPGCVTGRQVMGTTVGAVAGGAVAGPPGAVVGGVAGTTVSAPRRR